MFSLCVGQTTALAGTNGCGRAWSGVKLWWVKSQCERGWMAAWRRLQVGAKVESVVHRWKHGWSSAGGGEEWSCAEGYEESNSGSDTTWSRQRLLNPHDFTIEPTVKLIIEYIWFFTIMEITFYRLIHTAWWIGVTLC